MNIMNEPIEKTIMVRDTSHIQMGSKILINGAECIVTSITNGQVEYRKKHWTDSFKKIFKRNKK